MGTAAAPGIPGNGAIGLFFCRAACEAGGLIHAEALAWRFVGTVPTVVVVDDLRDSEARRVLTRKIRDDRLNAVVLAGPSPVSYEEALGGERLIQAITSEGINPNRIGYANLREQCVLAHADCPPEQVLDKAQLLTQVALSGVRFRHPVEIVEVPPSRRALVLGGGAGAVSAALRLIEQHIRVTLAVRDPDWTWDEEEEAHLPMAAAALEEDPSCTIEFSTEVTSAAGRAGDFTVQLRGPQGPSTLRCGGIVVAVGDRYAEHAELFPYLQVDTDDDGAPRSRNDHTLSARSAACGVSVVRAPGSDPDPIHRLRQQSSEGAVAALELLRLLRQPWVTHPRTTTRVDPNECGLCRTCIKVCAFHACSIDLHLNTAVVDETRCRACGNCVVACPSGARELVVEPTDQLSAAITQLATFPTRGVPRVLAMLCKGCAYRAADMGVKMGITLPISIMPLQVTCGGRVDMQHVLLAMHLGFDGVVIGTCRQGHCHNIVGPTYLDRRALLFRDILRSRGFHPDRVFVMETSPHEGPLCAATLTQFVDVLDDLDDGAVHGDLQDAEWSW